MRFLFEIEYLISIELLIENFMLKAFPFVHQFQFLKMNWNDDLVTPE